MTAFTFTGVILGGSDGYWSLCPELDVASQGDTVEQAKEMLLEAVTLYLETAIESNLPVIRPVPPDEDPRFVSPEAVAEVFPLKVDIAIQAYA
jgi:predicted RNase H-like HicB family nuclease